MKNKAEATLIAFLQAWKDNNHAKMYDLTQKTWRSTHSKKQLKQLINGRIKSFKVLEIREFMPTVYDANVVVKIAGNEKKITARMICETEPYKASVNGEFGVNPISVVKNFYK